MQALAGPCIVGGSNLLEPCTSELVSVTQLAVGRCYKQNLRWQWLFVGDDLRLRLV